MNWRAKHFSLSELCYSDIARAYGIDNTPDQMQAANLEWLSVNILDPVRNLLAVPCKVTSGFRSLALNSHPKIGGAATSDHLAGLAVDFQPIGKSQLTAAKAIAASKIPFKQLILELRINKDGVPTYWLHISGDPAAKEPKREVLHYPGHKPYLPGFPERWPL